MDAPIQTPRRGIAAAPPRRDLDSPEPLVNSVFEHQITVGWGDCDPAQIAYTAHIPAWGLAAVEAWYKACFGINWFQLNLEYGIGTPFVSLDFQFKSPVTSTDTLKIDVFVARMGNSSVKHVVEGYQNGVLCFVGHTVAAFVDAGTMKPIPAPTNMRKRINHYISIQRREFAS